MRVVLRKSRRVGLIDGEFGMDDMVMLFGRCDVIVGFFYLFSMGKRVATPNDPKLSDGGGWRGPCMAGGKAAAEARAVTAVAVRCSAWLGVIGLSLSVW